MTTERLLLKKIVPQDQQFIFEGLSHPDVIRFYGVSYTTFEKTAIQMKWYAFLLKEGTGIPWKIVNKQTGERMGVISVYLHKPEHNKAELGFWLLPQYWKQGFALEALKAVLHYWKTEKGLHRLEAFVDKGNAASSRLLEKAGFRYEGTMHDCELKNGEYISLLIYALLFENEEKQFV